MRVIGDVGEYFAISALLPSDFLSDILFELPLMHLKLKMTVLDTKYPIMNHIVSLILEIHLQLLWALLDFY